MLRSIFLALGLFATSCHHDPAPMDPKPGELPPLPPASGTPIGYLVDNAGPLNLRDDQLSKLKDLDTSLAARDDEIDTQLRMIERPEEQEGENPKDRGGSRKIHNHAPGASIHTTADAGKLHDLRKANDREALGKAFTLLDPTQQDAARKLLAERGVDVPGSSAKKPLPPTDDGVPLEP